MELVSDRRVGTLLQIIQAHVQPGTVIVSDEWRAYSNVGQLPNVAAHTTASILWVQLGPTQKILRVTRTEQKSNSKNMGGI